MPKPKNHTIRVYTLIYEYQEELAERWKKAQTEIRSPTKKWAMKLFHVTIFKTSWTGWRLKKIDYHYKTVPMEY